MRLFRPLRFLTAALLSLLLCALLARCSGSNDGKAPSATTQPTGAFSRSLRLPFAIKDEQIDAKYDKGVLIITIPKPAEAQTNVRRIEVKGA